MIDASEEVECVVAGNHSLLQKKGKDGRSLAIRELNYILFG